jgi:hypothetical protein
MFAQWVSIAFSKEGQSSETRSPYYLGIGPAPLARVPFGGFRTTR